MSFHLDIQMLLAFVHVQKQQEKRAEICSEWNSYSNKTVKSHIWL